MRTGSMGPHNSGRTYGPIGAYYGPIRPPGFFLLFREMLELSAEAWMKLSYIVPC